MSQAVQMTDDEIEDAIMWALRGPANGHLWVDQLHTELLPDQPAEAITDALTALIADHQITLDFSGIHLL